MDGLASRPFSLAEARVLYEIARRDKPAAADIARELGLDGGYISRILQTFEHQKLVTRQQSKTDERFKFLSLTTKGQRAFAQLDERSNHQAGAMLDELSPTGRRQLMGAVDTIRRLLGDQAEPKSPYLLRQHQPGDLGWVIQRQAILYVLEYGWDDTYEALAAEIVAQFIKSHDPKRERCWIAEKDSARVGAVLVARGSDEVAKLRLLHVEPEARGLGIGKRLVQESIKFGRFAGYQKMTLWTQSILEAARHIYKDAGFQLVREEQHHSFGKDLTGETWEIELRAPL